MSEPTDHAPFRVADHDLSDLVATVTRLVTESRKQGEKIARLEEPVDDGSESDRPGSPPPMDAELLPDEGPSSIFILALDGTTYVEELDALTNWVHNLLLPVYGREITTGRPWCRQWAEHPEAVARLHGLWLAWQQLTDVEAGLVGPATWHRDHLDPTWQQLRSPDGPFGACTTSPARPAHRLLATPEPVGA
ncbi:DUF4913 domain-containing protein [Streptomyces sp. G1]|uniref:DUF4913 domain-containing protein n=1 Tax=Streptomyces sp. G1 TaxID=361572 RepID=UPI00202F2A0A|nr:DUF4913 domain-containing protein [Streptomyces sp. G1]MCM1967977.1 DUF4913 domain-containing protein [Streptomyces sp. G1]